MTRANTQPTLNHLVIQYVMTKVNIVVIAGCEFISMKLLCTMGCGRSKLANKSNADAPENETNDYYHKKSNSLGRNNVIFMAGSLYLVPLHSYFWLNGMGKVVTWKLLTLPAMQHCCSGNLPRRIHT